MSDGNPLPYLAEASQSAARIFSLGRDLAILNAELRAKRQMMRMAWAGSAVLFLGLFILFPMLWITVEMHDRGWSALSLAILSATVFGSLAILFGGIARLAFRRKVP